MGLLLAKFAQKTFLIDISVIPGGHFKFRPLEKMLTFLGRMSQELNSTIKTH